MHDTMAMSKIDFSRRKGEVKGKHTDCVWGAVWEEESKKFIAEEDDEIMRGPPKKSAAEEEETHANAAADDAGDEDDDEEAEEAKMRAEKEKKKAEAAAEDDSAAANTRSGVGQVLTVSGDGRVTRWRREKDRRLPRDVMVLKSADAGLAELDESAEGTEKDSTAHAEDDIDSTEGEGAQKTPGGIDSSIIFSQTVSGCTCVDLHPTRTHLVLIGTEEGLIHKCTKNYSGELLQTYRAHKMPVYTVRWNRIHPRVFLSSGADWNVYLWDHAQTEPQLTFALGASVGDLCWAPFSATIFACCTAEGKVFVFDLNVNRQEPLCEQLVVRNVKLTKIAFSLYDPVILVGDEKGNVRSFKLSPNLRKPFIQRPSEEEEITRMEQVLEYAARCKEAGM